MASPARTPPAGNHSNEALDILRRLEPTLAQMRSELRQVQADVVEVKADMKRLDERQRKQSEDIAEIKGRLGELSARVPSIWTIAAMIVSLFGAAFVLIRFASGH